MAMVALAPRCVPSKKGMRTGEMESTRESSTIEGNVSAQPPRNCEEKGVSVVVGWVSGRKCSSQDPKQHWPRAYLIDWGQEGKGEQTCFTQGDVVMALHVWCMHTIW